jgi:hypothetical protein
MQQQGVKVDPGMNVQAPPKQQQMAAPVADAGYLGVTGVQGAAYDDADA